MISRLAIRNFRSLKDIELQPGRLTVLIGPNGSGKSNVIDALRFVDAFAWKGRKLNDEVARRGGWEELIWGGEADSRLSIEVDWKKESDQPASYATTIRGTEEGGAVSVAESVAADGTTLIEHGEDRARVGNRLVGHPGASSLSAKSGMSAISFLRSAASWESSRLESRERCSWGSPRALPRSWMMPFTL